jgi:hypothetical protein
MIQCRTTEQRDPVQLYALKQARLRWILLSLSFVLLLAMAYWVVYRM